jgi:hypothetical protein
MNAGGKGYMLSFTSGMSLVKEGRYPLRQAFPGDNGMRGELVRKTWPANLGLNAPVQYRRACEYATFIPFPLADGNSRNGPDRLTPDKH